jgi:hypothetical protein
MAETFRVAISKPSVVSTQTLDIKYSSPSLRNVRMLHRQEGTRLAECRINAGAGLTESIDELRGEGFLISFRK